MFNHLSQSRKRPFYRITSLFVSLTFTFSLVSPPSLLAQSAPTLLNLPIPGAVVPMTPSFNPMIVKGLNIDPQNPLQFDFIIDQGDNKLDTDEFNNEATKLIKYFLAALTVPEKEMWVNLSPYEKDRIIPETFGQTEMGRDLLAQDYMLKQLTASLMNPEDELGKKFWDRVYAQAQEKFGTTDIPLNTFNKIWIVPEAASIYEHKKGAFVVKSHLKVMLEEDYLALEANQGRDDHGVGKRSSTVNDGEQSTDNGVQSEIIKDILIPEIEKEVNQGETFSNLRQIYNSFILASWYKKALKESLLGQVYVDQNKTKGVDFEDKEIIQKIYEQYVAAFEKGVYNFTKEEFDPNTQEVIERKYFSGGAILKADTDLASLGDAQVEIGRVEKNGRVVRWKADSVGKPTDRAMMTKQEIEEYKKVLESLLENFTVRKYAKKGISDFSFPQVSEVPSKFQGFTLWEVDEGNRNKIIVNKNDGSISENSPIAEIKYLEEIINSMKRKFSFPELVILFDGEYVEKVPVQGRQGRVVQEPIGDEIYLTRLGVAYSGENSSEGALSMLGLNIESWLKSEIDFMADMAASMPSSEQIIDANVALIEALDFQRILLMADVQEDKFKLRGVVDGDGEFIRFGELSKISKDEWEVEIEVSIKANIGKPWDITGYKFLKLRNSKQQEEAADDLIKLVDLSVQKLNSRLKTPGTDRITHDRASLGEFEVTDQYGRVQKVKVRDGRLVNQYGDAVTPQRRDGKIIDGNRSTIDPKDVRLRDYREKDRASLSEDDIQEIERMRGGIQFHLGAVVSVSENLDKNLVNMDVARRVMNYLSSMDKDLLGGRVGAVNIHHDQWATTLPSVDVVPDATGKFSVYIDLAKFNAEDDVEKIILDAMERANIFTRALEVVETRYDKVLISLLKSPVMTSFTWKETVLETLSLLYKGLDKGFVKISLFEPQTVNIIQEGRPTGFRDYVRIFANSIVGIDTPDLYKKFEVIKPPVIDFKAMDLDVIKIRTFDFSKLPKLKIIKFSPQGQEESHELVSLHQYIAEGDRRYPLYQDQSDFSIWIVLDGGNLRPWLGEPVALQGLTPTAEHDEDGERIMRDTDGNLFVMADGGRRFERVESPTPLDRASLTVAEQVNGKLLTPRARKSNDESWNAKISAAVADKTAESLKGTLSETQQTNALKGLKKQSKNDNLQAWDLVVVGKSIALVGWNSVTGAIGSTPDAVMIDSFNTPFEGLSTAWQGLNADGVKWAKAHRSIASAYSDAELKAALVDAMNDVYAGKNMVESLQAKGAIGQALIEVATKVHDDWMANNKNEGWNAANFKPFDQLTPMNQLKDLFGLFGILSEGVLPDKVAHDLWRRAAATEEDSGNAQLLDTNGENAAVKNALDAASLGKDIKIDVNKVTINHSGKEVAMSVQEAEILVGSLLAQSQFQTPSNIRFILTAEPDGVAQVKAILFALNQAANLEAEFSSAPVPGNDEKTDEGIQSQTPTDVKLEKAKQWLKSFARALTNTHTDNRSFSDLSALDDELTINSASPTKRAVKKIATELFGLDAANSKWDVIGKYYYNVSPDNPRTSQAVRALIKGKWPKITEEELEEIMKFFDATETFFDGIVRYYPGGKPVGGIDFNPANLQMNVNRQGEGLELPIPQGPIDNFNVEGFIPVIINVTPATNLQLLLGINEGEGQDNLSSREGSPLGKVERVYLKEPEELVSLE